MLKSLILVGLGGGIGSVLRYGTTVFCQRFNAFSYPLSTFIVNIVGSLLIGFLLGYLAKEYPGNTNLKLLFITGFCGGFTTFSAFTAENLALIQNGETNTAIFYTLSSIVLGILAVWAGVMLAK